MQFVSPTILIVGAIAAVLIPVLIQLFNRTRYRVTRWAAMEFLLAAMKKTRKRVRIENLLLLFLRILALVLLAMMLARPSLDQPLFDEEARRHLIIVLDNSYSMTAGPEGETPLDRGRAQVKEWLEAVGNRGDLVSLILTSDRYEDYLEGQAPGEEGTAGDGGGGEVDPDAPELGYADWVRWTTIPEFQRFLRIRNRLAQIEQALDPNASQPEDDDSAGADGTPETPSAPEEPQATPEELEEEQDALRQDRAVLQRTVEQRRESGDPPRVALPRRDGGEIDLARLSLDKLATTDLEVIRQRAEAVPVTLQPVDWAVTFGLVRAAAAKTRESHPAKQITILTDLQRRNFPSLEDEDQVTRYRDTLREIPDAAGVGSGTVTFVDLGGAALNRTIESLEADQTVVGRNVPITLSATLRNNASTTGSGSVAQNTFTLRYTVDGESERDFATSRPIPPGESGLVTATIPPIAEPGTHVIRVFLDGQDDDLSIDNGRSIVVRVREAIQVLAVDGSPRADPTLSETFIFQIAIDLSGLSADREGEVTADDEDAEPVIPKTRIQLKTVEAEQLPVVALFEYDVIVLANLESFPAGTPEALADYVARGGNVIITLGDNVRPATYNSELFNAGLLPVPIEGLTRPADREFVGMFAATPWHPSVEGLARQQENDPSARLLSSVNTYRWFRVAWPQPTPAGLTRILDLNAGIDGRPDPLAFVSTLGRGAVAVFTSSLDGQWRVQRNEQLVDEAGNTFHIYSSYLAFWNELIYSMVDRGSDYRAVRVGETFRRPVSIAETSSTAYIYPPVPAEVFVRNEEERQAALQRAEQGVAVQVERPTRPDGSPEPFGAIRYRDTLIPGAYRVAVEQQRDALRVIVAQVVQDASFQVPRIQSEPVTAALVAGLDNVTEPAERRDAVERVVTDDQYNIPATTRIALTNAVLQAVGGLGVDASATGGRATIDRFVVNPSTEESDLRRIDADMFAELHAFDESNLSVEIGEEIGSLLEPQRSEIWKYVAALLLLFLVGEMILATTMSRTQR